jgi:hypothetical protein
MVDINRFMTKKLFILVHELRTGIECKNSDIIDKKL